MGDLPEVAFMLLTQECMRQDHRICGGDESCAELQAKHRRMRERDEDARQFDVGHQRWLLVNEQPSESWSTAALLRTVSDLLATPPTSNPLWRSIAITTALARLGERGLPADPVVRTGLGPGLIKKILGEAAFFWSAAQADRVARDQTPEVLRPWCAVLDDEASLTGVDSPAPSHVLAVALAGDSGALAKRWIQSAAIGHIVGWRISEYLKVDRAPGDVVLTGGRDATRWICERFTKTYPDEWRLTSLSWELAFNRDPDRTASHVGAPLKLLRERVVTDEMVTDALVHKLMAAPGADDELEGGLDGSAVIASLGSMLEHGIVEGARAMARRLLEAHPKALHLGMAYAFCTIPINRREARAVLDGLDVPEGSDEAVLRELNRAACALFDGEPERARSIVRSLEPASREDRVWLWDPEAALGGRPHVICETVSSWCARLAEVVPSPRSVEGP